MKKNIKYHNKSLKANNFFWGLIYAIINWRIGRLVAIRSTVIERWFTVIMVNHGKPNRRPNRFPKQPSKPLGNPVRYTTKK